MPEIDEGVERAMARWRHWLWPRDIL